MTTMMMMMMMTLLPHSKDIVSLAFRKQNDGTPHNFVSAVDDVCGSAVCRPSRG
jgi:hypothetical protein